MWPRVAPTFVFVMRCSWLPDCRAADAELPKCRDAPPVLPNVMPDFRLLTRTHEPGVPTFSRKIVGSGIPGTPLENNSLKLGVGVNILPALRHRRRPGGPWSFPTPGEGRRPSLGAIWALIAWEARRADVVVTTLGGPGERTSYGWRRT